MKRKFIICFTIVISVGALLYFGLDFGKKYVIEKSIEKIAESDITAKEQFAQYEEKILKRTGATPVRFSAHIVNIFLVKSRLFL